MRAWYVDRRNDPVLDVRMLVTFACALVMVLAWLLPREEVFRQMLAGGKADHVSLAYARLLVALAPEDTELRLLLATHYHQLGEFELAWETLDHPGMPATVLRATLILKLAHAAATEAQRRRWEALLGAALADRGPLDGQNREVLDAFAAAARDVGRPELAARFFEQRFLAQGDVADLEAAVRAWRAADDPARAAALFSGVADSVGEAVLALALETYLAAGRPADGLALIDRWLRNQEPGPELSFRLVEFARFANDAERIRAYLARVSAPHTLSDEALLELAGAAIATGELARAATFLELALSRQGDPVALRQELARLYRWDGRPEAALEQWLALVERTGSEAFIVRARELADGLYQYDTSAALLTRLAELRRLTDAEVAALRAAYEQRGRPEPGIEVLASYVARHPDHRNGWRELILLLENDLALARAADTWSAFNRRHPLDVKERLRWADLEWRQYHAEGAVEIMLAAETPDLPEYWHRLAGYAWFLDDLPLVSRAYLALLDGGEGLGGDDYERLIAALAREDGSRALALAADAWRSLGESRFLLQALQWALASGDTDRAAALIAEAGAKEDEFARYPEYWELVAYHHQQSGDASRALAVLERGLAHHPRHLSLITAYLWALNQSDDLKALAAALARYQETGERVSGLWTAFASGYARLGDHRRAAGWFARAVGEDPDDLALLLAYAGSLQAMGLADPAYRLRRHVVGEMARGRVSPEFDQATLAGVAEGILTIQDQRALAAWLEPEHPAFDRRTLPRLFLAQALRAEHYSAARYWLTRTPGADVWTRLALAAEAGDEAVLTALLDHEEPEVRIQAALALDAPHTAYRQAAGAPGLSEAAFAEVAGSYRRRFPQGWQVETGHSGLSDLAIAGMTLRGAGRYRDNRIRASLAADRLTDARSLVPGEIDELFLELGAGRKNRLGDLAASLTVLDSAGEQLPGFTLSQEIRLNRRNRVVLDGAWQQRTEITALARAAAQRSGVGLAWQSAPTRRDQLSLRASWDRYHSRYGEAVGEGGQLEVRYDHALLMAAPLVTVGSSLYLTRNDTTAGMAGLAGLLVAPDPLLLPDEASRISFNASVSRGVPGDLRWEVGSPRYRLGAGFGYQWPESAPTLELEASLGMRLLGRDELSLKTAYSSALLSGVGGDSYRASLVYSRQLGIQ